jgi:hypothetical protein
VVIPTSRETCPDTVPRRLAEVAGLTQSGVPAKIAGRSIKRMVPFDVAQGGEHVEPQLRK